MSRFMLRCMAVIGVGLTLAGDVSLSCSICSGGGGRGTVGILFDGMASVGLPRAIAARGCRLIRGAGRGSNLCLRGAGMANEGATWGENREGSEEQRTGEAGHGQDQRDLWQDDVSEPEEPASEVDSADPNVMSRGAFRLLEGMEHLPPHPDEVGWGTKYYDDRGIDMSCGIPPWRQPRGKS